MLLKFLFIFAIVGAEAQSIQPSECNTIQQHFYGVEANGNQQGGAIGPQGLPGKRGPSGADGLTGLPGPRGMKGEKGEKCEIPREITEELVELRREITKLRPKPIPKTCADIETDVSGYYLISPNIAVVKPFVVYCNFTSNPDKSVTMFGHDSEDEISVTKCKDPKCYSRDIVYENSLVEINQVVQQSHTCRQYVKYRCQASTFNWPKYKPFSSWTSPDGAEHLNWGGSPPSSGNTCKCGITGTCRNPEKQCNCDTNSDDILTMDDGYLVDKTQLPVIKLKFGDTDAANEHGWHTLGKLECFD